MHPFEIRPGIRRLFRLPLRRVVEEQADDEIALHLQLRTAQLVSEGMSPEAARAEAERRFGSIDEERARFRETARRRATRLGLSEWLGSVRQDLRYGLRTLKRDAGFAVFATLILALGIGASATVFSLVNALVLRPLPFRDPSHLLWISNIGDDGIAEWRLQVDHFLDLRARSRTLDGLAGYFAYYNAGDATLALGGETQRLTLVPVTCNFFPFLGVTPVVGRSFTADECRWGATMSVLLTDKLWRERFGADRSIVGRKLTIDGGPVTVIGVLPPSFDFGSVFAPGTNVDLFAPYPLSEETNRSGNTLATIGRLRPGVSVVQARSELVSLGKQLTDEYPRRNTLRPRVLALDERVNGRIRPALTVLVSAVAAVMLIVCANLASLQFARVSARQRELAVRVALGAGRARLIRQALTESLVLTGIGAILGSLLAIVATRLVSRMSAFALPLLDRVGVDGAVLAVAAIVAIVTGVVVGVLPAVHARFDVHDGLKDGPRAATRGAGHARVRAMLVITEIAAACVLLVASALLARSFVRVLDLDLGFTPERTAALRVDPARRFADQRAATAYYDDVLRRARAVPGVSSAALADLLPFAGDRSWGVAGQGQVYARDQYPQAFIRVVSDGYFKTMGIAMHAGRDFAEGDVASRDSVVIVNETLARMLWPGRDAIGQIVMNGTQRCRVVGVVSDVRHETLEQAFTGELYFPIRQMTDHSAVDLVVRTNLSQPVLAASVRAALSAIGPAREVATNRWTTLQELIDAVASPRRFVVLLLVGFSAFALLLAALGVYALIAYGVAQRTREIGIRIALGASGRAVRGTIMRGTLGLAAVGLLLGIGLSIAVVPLMRGMLFGVSWSDPASFAAAVLVLGVVAGAAGYFPARRASRVDPSAALRE
jgi:predicted permease